jgi:hypothetical protein
VIALPKPSLKPGWLSQQDYDQAPDQVLVRELCLGGKLVVTTLLCPNQASKQDIKQLYRSRWHIELDLRNIKSTMGLGQLSCRSPDMVYKEIWIYLLAYNLIRLLMAQAAWSHDCLPRQISFKHTVQIWVAWGRPNGCARGEDKVDVLFALIAQRRVGKRSGRVEPRAIKRRPKPYPLLMKPRPDARHDITRGWSRTEA